MRRRPSPVAASLALAIVLTALVMVLGTVFVPGDAPVPSAGPSAAGPAALRAASVTERVAATSRDAVRPTLTPSSSPASGPPTPGPASVPTDPADPTAGETSKAPRADPAGDPTRNAAGVPPAAEPLPPFKVRKARTLRKLPPGPVPGDPFTFQIGTLNVQGSQHRANGTGRAAALAGTIIGRGVDLVGLQEVQDDQLAVLQSRLSGYTVWPGQSLGNQGVRLQIAFRDSLFALVDTGSITTTFDFQRRPIPWVLLQERATGAEFYVIDVHNSPRDQEADRDAATGAEIALINSLRSSGKPVFIVGDTNESTEFACRVSAATGMVGSNGLTAAGGGGCSIGVGPIKIDHVMGVGGVDFSGHVVDYGAPVPASTDHAFVHSTVTVTPLVSAGEAAQD